MSHLKRPRSPSPGPPPPPPRPWSSRPAVLGEPCWFYAAGRCARSHCQFAHCSYTALLAAFSNRRPFSGDQQARGLWRRSGQFDGFFAQSPSSRDEWTAVLPVPLAVDAWSAFHQPLFAPTITALMRRPADPTEPSLAVEMGECQLGGTARMWGSVVLRGRREQVERGRDAVVGLMEKGPPQHTSHAHAPC